METGAMLNQFNQFICIQTRNVGAIAIGCPIDGLFNVFGVSLRYLGLREPDGRPTLLSDRRLTFSSSPMGWLKRPHRQRYWHGQLIQSYLYLRLQQS
jgi:hypothetical protein